MRHSFTAFLTLCAVLLGLSNLACSTREGAGAPIAPLPQSPDTEVQVNPDFGGATSNHQIWGLYNIAIDAVTLEVEVVPIRQADFTLNVTGFLQPPTNGARLLSLYVNGTLAAATPSDLVPMNGYVDGSPGWVFPGAIVGGAGESIRELLAS